MDKEGHQMAVINQDNHDAYKYEHDDIGMEDIPPLVDPERPPQRNDDNASGTCACGCACPGSSNTNGSGLREGFTQTLGTEPGRDDDTSRTTSEAGDDVDDGDQGVEHHLIEVGDFGYIPLSLIHRTLARHARCTCHRGILPHSKDYPFTDHGSPLVSGMTSPGDSLPDSLMVEVGSTEMSMASSGIFGVRSHGSTVFEHLHMPRSVSYEAVMQRLPLLYNPLQLTADASVRYPLELSISSLSSVSDRDFKPHVEDFAGFDMW